MLLKSPSWAGLIPGLPKTKKLNFCESKVLSNILQLKGSIFSLSLDTSQCDHYLLKNKNGTCYYIKKVEACFEKKIIEIEEVKKLLVGYGFSISRLLFTKRATFRGIEVIFLIYNYCEGRRFILCENDVSLVAEHVALLHNALNSLPHQDLIKNKTVMRYQQLNKIRLKLLNGAYKHSKYIINDKVVNLARNFSFDYFMYSDTVSTHGDLNPGNFLITPKGEVCFLDFEDVVHSHQPAIVELAYLIERLILIRIKKDSEIVYWSEMFLKYYKYYSECWNYNPKDNDVLELLVLRALCTILLYHECGIEFSTGEWNKFLFLYEIAVSKKNIFIQLLKNIVQ